MFPRTDEAIFVLLRKRCEIDIRQPDGVVISLRLARPAAGPAQNWECHACRQPHAAFGNDPEPGRARAGPRPWQPEGPPPPAPRPPPTTRPRTQGDDRQVG